MSTETIRTEIKTITPEMAKEMLTHNHCNRVLNSKVVNLYALEMASEHWHTTHQGIAFDSEGELVDGQHRLSAIVKANVPVTMLVSYNVERGSIDDPMIIDNGRGRSLKDHLQMNGIDDAATQTMLAIVKRYFGFYESTHALQRSPAVLLEYMNAHKEDMEKCYLIIRKRSTPTAAVPLFVAVAIFVAMRAGEPVEGLRAFVDAYAYKEFANSDSYAYLHAIKVREMFMASHVTNRITTFHEIESRVYAFLHNKKQYRYKENYYPHFKIKLVGNKAVEVYEGESNEAD